MLKNVRKRFGKDSLNLIQSLDYFAEDGLDIAHTENGGDDAPLVVVVDERLCLGVVGSQSLLDCGLVIVRPLVEFAAAGIALSGNFWLIEQFVVSRAALAHPSASDALDQLCIGNIDVQNHIDLLAQSGKDLIQCLCLGHGPGEAVQHPAALDVILG